MQYQSALHTSAPIKNQNEKSNGTVQAWVKFVTLSSFNFFGKSFISENVTLSKEHKQHKLIEQTRIINPSAHRQAINDELEKCFASRRQAKDDNKSNEKQPDNTKVSVKALREKFADKLEISCGYKWHRDYESTDDESLWQRIGFGLSLMSTPRSESNSVSSGDYCVHHYDH